MAANQGISNPAAGLLVYDIGARGLRLWDGQQWVLLAPQKKSATDAPGSFGTLTSTGTGYGYASAIKVMPDKSVYLAGSIAGTGSVGAFPFSTSNSTGFFARLDSSGVPTMLKVLGGGLAVSAGCIDVDAGGNIYIGGQFAGTANFSTGGSPVTLSTPTTSYDGYYAKYDASGALQWVKQVGSAAANDIVNDVVVDGSYLYVGGQFAGAATFNGAPINSAGSSDAFRGRVQTSSGNAAANPNGWVITFGSDQSENLSCMALWGGGVVVGGNFSDTCSFGGVIKVSAGSSDGYYVSVFSTGVVTGVYTVGGTGSELISDVAVDAASSIYISGRFNGSADLNPSAGVSNFISNAGSGDAFITKVSSSHTYQWAAAFGGTAADAGGPLAIDASGNIFFCGSFAGTAALGTFQLTSHGGSDGFLAKLNPFGNVIWAHSAGSTNNDFGGVLGAQSDGKVVYVSYNMQSTSGTFVGLGGNQIPASTFYVSRYEE